MLRGCDISNWQKGINVAGLDCDFVICKATEGTFFVDPYCDGFVQAAIGSGKLWGFYHFAREANPEEEAEFFAENCSGYDRYGIPVLDYEIWGNNYDDIEWCERFLSRYHDLTGVWPLLYIDFINGLQGHYHELSNSWIPQTCGLWLAGYPYDVPADYECPYDCSPWEFVAIWQYADDEHISGYMGDLDGDVAYMDAAAWEKYATGGNAPWADVEAPAEPEKKVLTGRVTIELD